MEIGEEKEAKAWQWVIENDRRPTNKDLTNKTVIKHWDWWGEDRKPHYSENSKIKEEIFNDLHYSPRWQVYGRYETQQEAWLDLIRVLVDQNLS